MLAGGQSPVVMSGGAVMRGAWVSFTLFVKLHVAVLLEASGTVQVVVVTPTGKNEPEAGEQRGEPTPGQLSLTVGGGKVLTAPH